jgi:hypothetical protein
MDCRRSALQDYLAFGIPICPIPALEATDGVSVDLKHHGAMVDPTLILEKELWRIQVGQGQRGN